MLESKLYFHRRVDYLYSQELKLLGLVRFIVYNFSSLDSLKVWYITLIRSKFEYASVVWSNLTLADPSKLENIQRKFAKYAIISLFSPTPFVNMNQCWIIYILNRFISCYKMLTLYFILTFSRSKLSLVLLWLLLVSIYPWSKLETFPSLKSVMSRDFVLQQAVSRLQTTSQISGRFQQT
jgi:hypothetical protein